MNITRRARIGMAIATAAAAASTGALMLVQSGAGGTNLADSCLTVSGKQVCVANHHDLGVYEFTPHKGDATGVLLGCEGPSKLVAEVLVAGKGGIFPVGSSCPF
jgi:hypothetical protein